MGKTVSGMAAVLACAPAVAWASPAAPAPMTVPSAAAVRAPAAPAPASAGFRLTHLSDQADPTFHVDDPRSMLRWGYGGSMVDLFPIGEGRFHLSVGTRLFGRVGRRLAASPEWQRLAPPFRAGAFSRRMTPALLVGYGRPVDRGLALGFDAGIVMGRIVTRPDRPGRFNRARADAGVDRGHDNMLVRATALYRF